MDNEIQLIKKCLANFNYVNAYRHNSASIRVVVVDNCFESLSIQKRHDMMNYLLDTLPENIQIDIISVKYLTPFELEKAANLFND